MQTRLFSVPAVTHSSNLNAMISRRYVQIPYVEELEDYRPGGFHPVRIGDRLKGGRYLIVNKLGHGSFSTVWISEDMITKSCVAISIEMAELSQGNGCTPKIKALQHLSKGGANQLGRSDVLLPLDVFELSGPNGTHFCIVTPLQGQSLSMVTKRKLGILSEVLPLPKAKRAALSAIRASAFTHKQNIVHGDLHPGNLLLSLSEEEPCSVEKVNAICGAPRTVLVRRVDGMPLDDSVPKCGVEEALGRLSDISLYSGALKLSDFGCAFFADDPPSEIDFFGPYIAPEQYCTGHIGYPTDVWALGCAIFLILSGRDFFGIPDDSVGKVFSIMSDTLGEPPEYILRSWEGRVSEDFKVSNNPSRPLAARIRELRYGNELLGMKNREYEFSDSDIALLTDLLGSMLRYEPNERLTMEAVLNHPAMAILGGKSDVEALNTRRN